MEEIEKNHEVHRNNRKIKLEKRQTERRNSVNARLAARKKAKQTKTGDCIECGENSTIRDLLFRYKQDDLLLVKSHIEDHLTSYPKHESVTPDWCKKCQCLLGYTIRMKDATL